MTTLRAISLGLGVQSSTLFLMATRGDIGPMPDCAITADPGWERKKTYEYLEYLRTVSPIPIHVVRAGNIREDLLNRASARSGRFVTVPYFLKTTIPAGTVVDVLDADDNVVGQRVTDREEIQEGLGRRQCTSHYKIEPINRKLRELIGAGPRDKIAEATIEQWVGISLDEIERATPSKVRYAVKRFPLLEERMSRSDCIRWLEERQYRIPPKSACVGCPFHDDDAWRDLKLNSPDEFDDAVIVDHAIRTFVGERVALRAEQFTHRSLKPLDEVDFSNAEDRGQMNLFAMHECEGMCGL